MVASITFAFRRRRKENKRKKYKTYYRSVQMQLSNKFRIVLTSFFFGTISNNFSTILKDFQAIDKKYVESFEIIR